MEAPPSGMAWDTELGKWVPQGETGGGGAKKVLAKSQTMAAHFPAVPPSAAADGEGRAPMQKPSAQPSLSRMTTAPVARAQPESEAPLAVVQADLGDAEVLPGTNVLDAPIRAPAAAVVARLLEALDDDAGDPRYAAALGITEKTEWAAWVTSPHELATKERTVKYKVKSPVGITRVLCDAKARDVGRTGAVLFVDRTRAPDVPNGDRFVTVVRKLVAPSADGDACTLRVTVDVEYSSSFVTQGMVRAGAVAETKARMRKVLALLKEDTGDSGDGATTVPGRDVEEVGGAPGGLSESSMDEQCMKYAAPDPGFFEKGNISNLITFFILVVGVILRVLVGEDDYKSTLYARCVLAAGVFGFSGGVTNLLAVRMLFDEIPGVYGSGIIPKQFESIKKAIRAMILDTFFEEKFLARQVQEKIGILHDQSTVSDALDKAMAVPAFGTALEDKLSMLMTTPIGAMIVAAGATPASLVPIVKPIIRQVGLEVAPRVANSLSNQAIPLDKFRDQVDRLIEERLAELTAHRVRMLVEAVMKANLGWLVVWGNVLGSTLGLIAEVAFYLDGQ